MLTEIKTAICKRNKMILITSSSTFFTAEQQWASYIMAVGTGDLVVKMIHCFFRSLGFRF